MERACTQRWLTVLGSFVLLVAISVSVRGAFLVGQALNQAALSTEMLQVHSGDIVEMLPVHTLPSPLYSWVLTQDRTFLEAGQDRVFRTRLIRPGTYTLNAEIAVSDRSQKIRRIFRIEVVDQSVPADDRDSTFIVDLVRTEPPLEGDEGNISVILDAETQLLRLFPLQEGVLPLSIDLDVLNDENNDDNPRNDTQNTETFFYETGSPLYLWFSDGLQEKEIVIHARGNGDVLQEQSFRVLSSSFARSQGLTDLRVDYSAEATDALTYQFAPLFPDGTKPTIPILYEWDFGDGQNSLEENPLHTFQTFGSYTVGITVRNVSTGDKLGSRVREITIEAPAILPEQEGPSEVEKQQLLEQVEGSEPQKTDKDAKGGSIIGILFVVGLIVVTLGGAGFGVLLLIRKIRARAAETVQAETLQQTPPQITPEEQPENKEVPQKEKKKEEVQEKTTDATGDSGEPDWLKDSSPATKTEPQNPNIKPPQPPTPPAPPKPQTPPAKPITPPPPAPKAPAPPLPPPPPKPKAPKPPTAAAPAPQHAEPPPPQPIVAAPVQQKAPPPPTPPSQKAELPKHPPQKRMQSKMTTVETQATPPPVKKEEAKDAPAAASSSTKATDDKEAMAGKKESKDIKETKEVKDDDETVAIIRAEVAEEPSASPKNLPVKEERKLENPEEKQEL
ncbi:hypothetical protein COU76_00335 [Candidatus Peregrinibacteria bacterium CG10_big_fil_rev_8_21_14_0_10_49_10]|nr:MAG: hypothetical protein COU76_00335 [Candidatus Peregrinibacteria bacterium CG10_big_fil_rev_8_21_14_0_10_49_10]